MKLVDRARQTISEVEDIEIGSGVVDRTGRMFRELFPGRQALVIADENTFAAAGTQVLQSLSAAGVGTVGVGPAGKPLVLPGKPTLQASYEIVTQVRDIARQRPDAVICSVGSGTVTDVAKLASFELDRRCLSVCTAASVDAYSAPGAAIMRNGFKTMQQCRPPAGLVLDLDVMSKAPHALTAAGYGDLFAKIPAGADWILAEAIGEAAIDAQAWDMVQGRIWKVLAHPERLATLEMTTFRTLVECSVLSGMAMQVARSSGPVAGTDHMFSHVWDMEGHSLGWEPPLLHGFKVAVGAVAACALWERALRLDLTAIDVDGLVAGAPTERQIEEHVRAIVPARIADEAVEKTLDKRLYGSALADRLRTIQQVWPEVVERVRTQVVGPRRAAELLRAAGAPVHYSQIGITRNRFSNTHFKAQMIRSRYTVLDLLTELGMLGDVVAQLFSPDGYWGEYSCP